MAKIDIYYQGEGLRGIQHLEVHPDSNLGEVKVMLIEKHGLPADILIFLEDAEDPADEASAIHAHKGKAGVKLHVHRSHKIEVAVTYNGCTVEHHFGPGTTIAHVKQWAAEREFGMSAEDAGEHLGDGGPARQGSPCGCLERGWLGHRDCAPDGDGRAGGPEAGGSKQPGDTGD